MKILILTSELKNTCGVSNHLYNLCIGLKKNSIDITIACPGGESIKRFTDLGVNVCTIPQLMHEKRNILNYINAYFKLFYLIRKNNYNIVHSHNHYCANIAKNVCRLTGIKTIQSNHGILPKIGRLKHFAADYYVAVNDHIKDYMIEQENIPKENIFLIYNGIWKKTNSGRFQRDKIKFIAASRLIKEKGIQDFIKAVHLLDKNIFMKAEFYIAGEGYYEAELNKLNEKLGGRVTFLGNVINLSERLNDYDIFVMATSGKYEGLPMVLIEAAFSGCIIISSSFTEMNKIFSEENGCLLYDKGDAGSLSVKIEYVIGNYPDSLLKAKKLNEIAVRNFGADLMTEKVIQLYSKVTNEN